MALIKCPECKKKISDSVVTCPRCGAVLTEGKKDRSRGKAKKQRKGKR